MTEKVFTHERYVDLDTYHALRGALNAFLLEAGPLKTVTAMKFLEECVRSSAYGDGCTSCREVMTFPYEGEPIENGGYRATYQCPNCGHLWHSNYGAGWRKVMEQL